MAALAGKDQALISNQVQLLTICPVSAGAGFKFLLHRREEGDHREPFSREQPL